jgi:hypothetical protein
MVLESTPAFNRRGRADSACPRRLLLSLSGRSARQGRDSRVRPASPRGRCRARCERRRRGLRRTARADGLSWVKPSVTTPCAPVVPARSYGVLRCWTRARRNVPAPAGPGGWIGGTGRRRPRLALRGATGRGAAGSGALVSGHLWSQRAPGVRRKAVAGQVVCLVAGVAQTSEVAAAGAARVPLRLGERWAHRLTSLPIPARRASGRRPVRVACDSLHIIRRFRLMPTPTSAEGRDWGMDRMACTPLCAGVCGSRVDQVFVIADRDGSQIEARPGVC